MILRYALIVLMTAAMASVPAAVAAEGEAPLGRGTFTFGLDSGGWHRYSVGGEEGSFSVFTLSPLVGIFAADRVWLGGGISMAKWEGSDGEWGSNSGASVHGGVDYHFLASKWTPFVGFWGLLGDYPGDGFMARFGARFFVVPRTALGFGYDGAVVFDENYYGENEVGTSHRLWYGFQLYF